MDCRPAISIRKAKGHIFQMATRHSEKKARLPMSQKGRSLNRCSWSTRKWFTAPVSRCSMKFQVMMPAYIGSA